MKTTKDTVPSSELLAEVAPASAHASADPTADLLTENLPYFGTVSLLFFLPEDSTDREKTRETVHALGGAIAPFHECFTYQLRADEDKDRLSAADYFPGPVYSTRWLGDSAYQR